MVKLWITGGTGLLGSSLRARCEGSGIACAATSSREADVTDLPFLSDKAREIGPTHIIHCAAYTDVDGAEKEPDRAFAVNADGAENVARAALLVGAKLVHISTDYVFDGKQSSPYTENAVCHPINVYGKSKWEGEKRVLELFPSACVIRTSWLFGARGKNFISSLLGVMKENETVKIVSDQVGKPTYCGDLIDAILQMLDQEGVFHFANSGVASRYEVGLEIYRLAHELGIPLKCQRIEPVESSFFPTRAIRPSYSALDTGKISRLLQSTPRPWKEALKHDLQ